MKDVDEAARRQRQGLVHLSPEKLQRQALRAGISKTQLANLAGIKRATVQRAFRGQGVFLHTAAQIAKSLEVDDVTLLVASDSEEEHDSLQPQSHEIGEWTVADYLGPWRTASNGLQFRLCHMRHRYVPNRSGRGKWYDLLHLSARDRESLRAHLVRHATVCQRIGIHAHVADNLGTLPARGEESWWVIDRWIAGRSLADVLEDGPYSRPALPRLMTEIALGLQALHAAKVAFRELAPSRVIIEEHSGRAVLTDFELAKLLDTGPTVSNDWPEDPYRAPEVESGHGDERSDLYSWGRILVHAVTGQPPLNGHGEDSDAITEAGLPKAVWRVATDCLSEFPGGRPRNVGQVLRAMRHWKQ